MDSPVHLVMSGVNPQPVGTRTLRGAFASRVGVGAVGIVLVCAGLSSGLPSRLDGTGFASVLLLWVGVGIGLVFVVQALRARVVIREQDLLVVPLTPGRAKSVPLRAIEGVAAGAGSSMLIPAVCPVLECRSAPGHAEGELLVERIRLDMLNVWTTDTRNAKVRDHVEAILAAIKQEP